MAKEAELVALARDKKEIQTSSRTSLLDFYEKNILVSHGSRWIWALSYVSSIEAMVRMIAQRGTEPLSDQASANDEFDALSHRH
ncbi:hypothetical protein [Bradyrhizobium paxllaeri]|uniref:hypothetical protein n=1 Tax=Bradyrhizobium paxllaeri TaxID=190148 RepID=UPI000810978F|nr:hypothetical protein [Bradyrhizobium paxllaeri]